MNLAAAVSDAGLGLRRGVVAINDYSARWPAAFRAVVVALWDGRPDGVAAIEHIGSTAVPELPAKPILDIAIGLRRTANLDAVHEWLLDVGMLYRGENEGVRPDLMYGYELEQNVRLINAHVIEFGGRGWVRYIRFRDRLRTDAIEREAYAALKHRLATELPSDRLAYIDGKTEFIRERRDGDPR